MNRALVRANQPAVAISVFIAVYAAVLWAKPAFLYSKDGSLRHFGVGSKRKTVIPAWLLAMVIAILAYLGVMYYVAHPQLMQG